MPETLKSLLAKRDLLMNRADALRKTDPKMADYLDGLGNNMDGELEGTVPMQERDENGFLQLEDPDHMAFQEASARIRGNQDDGYDADNVLKGSPTFQAQVQKHLGEQMRNDWLQKLKEQQGLQYQTPEGAPIYNNSVTPDATTLKEIEEARKKRETLAQLQELING